MFVDITQQFFALLPQIYFPAHNLNFRWRWRWWDQIQAIFLNFFYFNVLSSSSIWMYRILNFEYWIFLTFFHYSCLEKTKTNIPNSKFQIPNLTHPNWWDAKDIRLKLSKANLDLMRGSPHVPIGIEYRNCCWTWDVYLRFATYLDRANSIKIVYWTCN